MRWFSLKSQMIKKVVSNGNGKFCLIIPLSSQDLQPKEKHLICSAVRKLKELQSVSSSILRIFSAFLTARCEAINKLKVRRSWSLQRTKTYPEFWLDTTLCFIWMCTFLSLHCLLKCKSPFTCSGLIFKILFGPKHVEMDLKGKHESLKRASLNFLYTSY